MIKKVLLALAATGLLSVAAPSPKAEAGGYWGYRRPVASAALRGTAWVAGRVVVGRPAMVGPYGYPRYGAYASSYGAYPSYSYGYAPSYRYSVGYPSYGYSYPSYGYSYSPSYGYGYSSYSYGYGGTPVYYGYRGW